MMDVVPFPGVRVAAAESMNRDLCRVSLCYDLWGIKLNVRKSMIVYRPLTIHHQSPTSLGEDVLDNDVHQEIPASYRLWGQ